MKKITKQLQEKTMRELEKETQLLREEMAKLRLKNKTNLSKDTNLLVKRRKRLAAVLTILTEKRELEEIKKLES